MAYVSGTANSLAALQTAIQTAFTSNAWTLSGDVLHKSGCYFRLWSQSFRDAYPYINGSGTISSQDSTNALQLFLTGGTGIDGSNQLTGRITQAAARLGPQFAGYAASTAAFPFQLPVNYEIHIHPDPDEVYIVVNHDVDRYQHLALGHAPLAQLTGGTGAWFGGSFNPVPQFNNGSAAPDRFYAAAAFCASGGSGASWQYQSGAPLFFNFSVGGANSSISTIGSLFSQSTTSNWDNAYWIHHGVDGARWGPAASAIEAFPRLIRSPSAINGVAPLINAVPQVLRPSNKLSAIAQLAHARLIRLDHHEPGEIITLGPDRWKVYPWLRRNPEVPLGRNGGGPDTGALGWAIRYTGP